MRPLRPLDEQPVQQVLALYLLGAHGGRDRLRQGKPSGWRKRRAGNVWAKPIARAAGLVTPTQEWQRLRMDADSDKHQAFVVPSQVSDFGTLEIVRSLADAR